MKVNQEIDALRTLGLDPVEVLVVPRLLALMIALPLLAFFADLLSLFGGVLCAPGARHLARPVPRSARPGDHHRDLPRRPSQGAGVRLPDRDGRLLRRGTSGRGSAEERRPDDHPPVVVDFPRVARCSRSSSPCRRVGDARAPVIQGRGRCAPVWRAGPARARPSPCAAASVRAARGSGTGESASRCGIIDLGSMRHQAVMELPSSRGLQWLGPDDGRAGARAYWASWFALVQLASGPLTVGQNIRVPKEHVRRARQASSPDDPRQDTCSPCWPGRRIITPRFLGISERGGALLALDPVTSSEAWSST